MDKPTFLEEEGRLNTATHAVYSGATLRNMWTNRQRAILFREMAQIGDVRLLPQKTLVRIENALKAEAKYKFPYEGDYRVRIVKDDLVTPVEVIGDEVEEITPLKPE